MFTQYNLKGKESFSGIIHSFFSSAENWNFSVGSDSDNYIHIRDIAPTHVSCHITDNALRLKAKAAVQVVMQNGRHTLTADQNMDFPLPLSQKSFSSFEWKLVFNEHTSIIGKIAKEETLASASIEYLQSQYGELQNVNRGTSSSILKTHHGKIIKVLRRSFMKPGVIRRFINAARKFQLLPTHQFLKIHEVVYLQEHSLCYVVMEHFAGQTLENYLLRKGVLPIHEAQAIVQTIAECLVTLNDRGYCCRNLTLGNILVRDDKSIRITGFFLLKTADTNINLPELQMVIPKFTAPEQIDNPAGADIAADIFSLGVIFYALLAGEPPFNLHSKKAYCEFLANARPLEASDILNAVPELTRSTCEFIASLLALNKSQRPTPLEVVEYLSNERDSMVDSIYDLYSDSLAQALAEDQDESSQLEDSYEESLQLSSLIVLDKDTQPAIGGILEDPEEDLSEGDISQLKELRLSTIYSSSSEPASSMRDTNKRLQEAYKNLPVDKKSASAQKKASATKSASQSSLPNLVIASVFTAAAIIVVFILYSIFSSHENDKQTQQSSKKTIGKPASANKNSKSEIKKTTVLKGKIFRLDKPSSRLQYFVIFAVDNPVEKHVVSFPTAFSQECAQWLETAKQREMVIEVRGVEKTVSRGVLSISATVTTRRFLLPTSIQIGEKIFGNR